MRILPFLLAALVWCTPAQAQAQTALDRYVAAPDPAYRYETAGAIPCDGCTAVLLDMTSQNWLTPEQVDRTSWRHWLTVIRPQNARLGIAVLLINGGSNSGSAPSRADSTAAAIAKQAGVVVADLRMVPNQPLRFAGDPANRARSEDALIAYGWDQYLRGGGEEWLARLPMTKSAVRAMDTVTDFSRTEAGGGLEIGRFIVTGASKRGWTAWTTAAVDKRVVAVVPIVIDVLNVAASLQHHWRAYGFWAPAIRDYSEIGIMDWAGTERFARMLATVDPYSYRDRLTMPKLILNAAGDQFFLPDSSQFYFDGLLGEKHLRYVPNADHSLRGSDAASTLAAFVHSVVENRPRPSYRWRASQDGALRVETTDRPERVTLWQATNPKARDFRLEAIGQAWTSSVVEGNNGVYAASVPKPPQGWTAFFVEMTYAVGGSEPLKLTTPVRVVPDTLPFPEYVPKR